MMTTRRITLDGGSTDIRGGANADGHSAEAELINVLDMVDIPIVVLGDDCVLMCFNRAADVLRLSPSDIGRTLRDVSIFGGSPRLEEHCRQVIASGVGSRVDFHDGQKGFVVSISPYAETDRRVTGAVLAFTNVTALRASIDQVIYERLCTRAIVNSVADPLVVLSADQRIQSANRAFYTMFFELASLRMHLKAMLVSPAPQP